LVQVRVCVCVPRLHVVEQEDHWPHAAQLPSMGQGGPEQLVELEPLPAHCAPPCCGDGRLHDLERLLEPVAQVTLQLPQPPHVPQPPSIGQALKLQVPDCEELPEHCAPP